MLYTILPFYWVDVTIFISFLVKFFFFFKKNKIQRLISTVISAEWDRGGTRV
jgi:hypothetical protein